MKRLILIILAACFFLCACGIDPIIPDQKESSGSFTDSFALYENAVEAIKAIPYDCLVSRTEYYRPEAAGDYVGQYILNMENDSFEPFDSDAIKALLSSGVKLIDMIRSDDLTVISFSLCIPGRSYDYGYYYCSENKPVYLGDPSLELKPDKTGFSYEKKGNFGTGATYYTEQLAENYFYYEIT